MSTKEELQNDLLADELDYVALAEYHGRDALGAISELLHEGDDRVAPKAIYLASVIGGPAAVDMLVDASQSKSDLIRVACAGALANLDPEDAVRIADELVQDQDLGIRVRTAKSLGTIQSPDALHRLQELSGSNDVDVVRLTASKALNVRTEQT